MSASTFTQKEVVGVPLDKSGSKASVGKNIKTEQEAGKPHNQAVAIALDVQRRANGEKKKRPDFSDDYHRRS